MKHSSRTEELILWVVGSKETAHTQVDPSIRLGPPISRPSKIVCIGCNYRDHAAESRAPVPKEPIIFLKSTTAMCGPNDNIVMPRNGLKLNWEAELTVVIGKGASYVPKENAPNTWLATPYSMIIQSEVSNWSEADNG
jgi:2,4-diketo-3-deoxy-L-fuconate hydrolase